jgi:ribosomal protein S6
MMSETQTNTYEGLFLFPQSAGSNLQAASEHVIHLLDRSGGEILSFGKWDERRLAFEIKGSKRGVYFLSYFKCDPTKLISLERDCNLSEQLLRAMITRADQVTDEIIEAAEGRTNLAEEIKVRAEQAAEREVEEKVAADDRRRTREAEEAAAEKAGGSKEAATESKSDAPKSDAPKSDAPKSDAPKSDAPKSDAPKSDAPKSDAPKSDAPKSDAPKSDAPAADAPGAATSDDAPATDDKKEAPATQE